MTSEILNDTLVNFDCLYFKGAVPCKPNKEYGVVCAGCKFYTKYDKKILIIKLGAAGDVIRTTPLLYPLKKEYPNAKVYWLTYYPAFVPVTGQIKADEVLKYNEQNITYLKNIEFDLVINLDKDNEAVGLVQELRKSEVKGFIMKDGVCYPADENARHKFLTGIFDVYSKNNVKSYPEEIFEICGYEYNKEHYIVPLDKAHNHNWDIDHSKTVVGLNTGCGERWTSRLWEGAYWVELIDMLHKRGYEVVLLGGPSEDERNAYLEEETRAKYFGVYDIETFKNLVNACDIVVTQVTMAMHIALGLNKKLVLMNNIFNKNEFELFGNGIILEPRKACKCYFRGTCVNPEYTCMEHLYPETVFGAIEQLVKKPVREVINF